MLSDVHSLRARHRAALTTGRVRTADLWAQDCLAYNVIIRPTQPARERLSDIGRTLAAEEPALLCVPADAMHLSVTWLLAVHRRYEVSKAELWAERGVKWLDELRAIAKSARPFRLLYRSLAATDSAVIAVAEPSEPVNELRRQIAARLELPPQSAGSATLAHSTLCRYAGPLSDPASLLAAVDRYSSEVTTSVDFVEVSKELRYPSLRTECIARFTL